MEATGSGALLRQAAFAPRRVAGDVGLPSVRSHPATVRISNGFKDEGHLRYYASSTPARCGPKKEEKRKLKLVKGLEKDLSALYSIGFGLDKGEGVSGEVKGQMISEAADVLLAQLTKLRAEAEEMKMKRKQEKKEKKAAKMKTCGKDHDNSSSSSESSDSECETVVKMRSREDPVAASALQTEDVVSEAKKDLTMNLDSKPDCCTTLSTEVPVMGTESKIEVCMGGKCKRSGAMELKAEFEKAVGIEGVVAGCKCMGKCRDGPNVRVVNRTVEEGLMKAAKGPLCIGVGLEDVGAIVADFFREKKDAGFLAAS